MTEFNILYEENKKLDEIFHKLYDNYNRNTIEKNILELLVEIGELANETRCFKYWSKKKASEKSTILDEYADVFLMTLYFCHMIDLELSEDFTKIKITDPVAQFKKLYSIVSKLNYSLNKKIIKEILANVVNLGKILNFTDNEIIEGCVLKIEKNKNRFETGF
jgi:dimeric dUTPase (all-alpha-NTP-PPase superfamily)